MPVFQSLLKYDTVAASIQKHWMDDILQATVVDVLHQIHHRGQMTMFDALSGPSGSVYLLFFKRKEASQAFVPH